MKRRRSVFTRITLLVLVFAVYTFAVVFADLMYLNTFLTVRSTVHSLLALVLGGLLVFRTNTAYDRWWEGRKLWGQLVNDTRNLAIKIRACVATTPEDRMSFATKLVAFCFALKEHLRRQLRLQECEGYEQSSASPQHVPAFICTEVYTQLEDWRSREKIGAIELLFLDTHAASLMNICGACERILKTPIAPAWRDFIRQIIGIYLLTLPWGLVEDMGFWTIPVAILVAYFMIGLEAIAEDIEQPFGLDADDLKLDEFVENIRRSVFEIVSADIASAPSKEASA